MKHGNSIARHGILGKIPLTLQWDLTYDCNSECIYCRSKGFKNYSSDLCLSADQIEKIVEQLARWNFRRIKLLGGEPLLHKHIFDIISLCKKKDIKTTLFTNTRKINYNLLLKLKENGLNDIIFSIDSMDESENNYLRSPNAYQSSINALNSYQDLFEKNCDLPHLHINSTMTKVNKNGLLSLLDLSQAYSVSTYNFSLLDGGSIESNLFTEIALNEAEIIEVIEKILIKSRKLGVKSFVSGLKPLAALYFSKTCDYELPVVYSGCKGGFTNFFMYPDGKMWPCQRTAEGYNIKYPKYKYKYVKILDNIEFSLQNEWTEFREFVGKDNYLVNSWPCNNCKFAYWICRPCPLEKTVSDMTKVGVCYSVAKKIGGHLNDLINEHFNIE